MRAALDEDQEAARTSWNTWWDAIDFEAIEHREMAVLPFIWQRLQNLDGVSSNDRLRGYMRQVHYRNTLYREAAAQLEPILGDQQLGRWVREFAFQQHIYADPAARPVHYLELFALPEQVQGLVDRIKKMEWNITEVDRYKVQLSRQNVLILDIRWMLSPHWGKAKHEHIYTILRRKTPGVGSVALGVDLLSNRMTRRGWTDLISIIDCHQLVRALGNHALFEEMDDTLAAFYMGPKWNIAMQSLTPFIEVPQFRSVDTQGHAAALHRAYERYITRPTVWRKLRYHYLRYALGKSRAWWPPLGFARYYQAIKHERRLNLQLVDALHPRL